MTSPSPVLRPYRPEDREALFDICVRTGHEGGDARHLYPDPGLLPNIFAAPYAVLEPELAFVVEDGGRAVGYILGTADTASFVDRYRAEWLPGLAERYQAPVREPATPTEEMTALMHDPERMILPELADYPAHLHIDLLPTHQRSGHGRMAHGDLPRRARRSERQGGPLGHAHHQHPGPRLLRPRRLPRDRGSGRGARDVSRSLNSVTHTPR